MENNLDYQLIIMQYLIETNKQRTDKFKKILNKHDHDFTYMKNIRQLMV